MKKVDKGETMRNWVTKMVHVWTDKLNCSMHEAIPHINKAILDGEIGQELTKSERSETLKLLRMLNSVQIVTNIEHKRSGTLERGVTHES